MAEERITIIIREDGSREVSRNIRDIGSASTSSEKAVNTLKGALAALGGALAIDRLREYADTFIRVESLVNIFSRSQAETNLVIGKLYDIANRTRQGLESVTKAYHQMSIAGRALGATQEDMLVVTEAVSKAFAIQGTPTNVAKAGILQLGHAFTEGIVRGRQFNSLLIEMPRVLEVAAKHIDGADGSLSKLRAMMLAGTLTSKKLFDGIVAGASELDPLFAKTGKTFSQAFTILNNGFIAYIGGINKASGASTAFFNLAELGVAHIDDLAKGLAILGSAFIVGGIVKVAEAISALGLAAAANPILTLVSLLTAATAAALLYKDQIILVADEQLTLGDYLGAFADLAKKTFSENGPKWIQEFEEGVNRALFVVKALGDGIKGLKEVFSSSSGVDNNANALDRNNQFQKLIAQRENLKDQLSRSGNSFFQDPMAAIFGGNPDDLKKKLAETNALIAKAQDDNKKLLTGQKPANDDSQDQGFMADLTRRAKLRRDARQKELKQEQDDQKKAASGLSVPLGAGDDFEGDGKKKKTYKNPLDNPNYLASAYRSLLNQIQPLSGAVEEYARAQDILNREEAAGNITSQRKAELLDLVKNHYRDIVDPVGAYVRNLQRENQFMAENSRQRQVSQALYQEEETLRKQGVFLSDETVAQLKAQIIANQELARITGVKDQIYGGVLEDQEKYVNQLKAINILLKNKDVSPQDLNRNIATNDSAFSGTQDQLDAQRKAYTDYYAYIDGLQQAHVISSQTASQVIAQKESEYNALRMQNTQTFFGNLASLSKVGNKKVAAIGKAAAIAQATIDGVLAVQKALASAPPPVSYALAAAAGAAAAVNVATIASQELGFKTGGNFTVGGAGGPDSQMVAFRATPGEKVTVNTPAQARAIEDSADGTKQAQQPPTIINVLDPSLVRNIMTSSGGRQDIINAIKADPDTVNAILGR